MADEKIPVAQTAYLVLVRRDGKYEPLGRYVGSSSRALKHFASAEGARGAQGLVAVPVRSWTEVEIATVRPEPRTTLKRVEAPSGDLAGQTVLAEPGTSDEEDES